MADFWIWRYELAAAGALNAQTQRVIYPGALVRSGSGFGCVHAWPELGDPTLDECLADLAGPQEGRLVRRTLACLASDGAARERGRSLFDALTVPISHATLPRLSEDALADAVARGFRQVKIKGGAGGGEDLRRVRGLMSDWPELRWRVDFNEAGDADELLAELAEWSSKEKARFDFFEDPVSYHGGDWARVAAESGVAMANDRHLEEDRGDSAVRIVKPAVNEMVSGGRVLVTSYMDHPLGQAFAAWEAARVGITEVCGLQTHALFRKDEFGEMLGDLAPAFRVPEGTGLGFDDLLEKLPWTKLRP